MALTKREQRQAESIKALKERLEELEVCRRKAKAWDAWLKRMAAIIQDHDAEATEQREWNYIDQLDQALAQVKADYYL